MRQITDQPSLTSIIEKRLLLLFGHLARKDEQAEASRIMYEFWQNSTE